MAQAVESTKETAVSIPEVSETPVGQAKPSHLHLVDEKTDPNIRVGTRLRNARVEKNLSIEDVAKHLRFRREYLEAIENMQVGLLPRGFVNPYIRDYARHLGLDPARCVEDFNIQCGALSQAEEEKPQQAHDPAKRTRLLQLGVAGAIAALMAVGGWLAYDIFSKSSTPEVVAAKPAPVIAVTPNMNGARMPVTQLSAPAVTAASDTMKLQIRAQDRAWIEIRGADGTLYIDRPLARGETYDLRVGAGWTLTTQNAGAFEWVVNGEAAGLVGETNQALYTLGVDEAAVGLAEDES